MTAVVRGARTKSNLRLLVRTDGDPPSAVFRRLCPKQKLPFAPSAHQTHQELFCGSQSFHYFASQAYCKLMWQSDNSMCRANQAAFVYDKNKICTYWNYDFQDEIWIISNILTWVSQTQKSPQSTNPMIIMIKSVFLISVTFQALQCCNLMRSIQLLLSTAPNSTWKNSFLAVVGEIGDFRTSSSSLPPFPEITSILPLGIHSFLCIGPWGLGGAPSWPIRILYCPGNNDWLRDGHVTKRSQGHPLRSLLGLQLRQFCSLIPDLEPERKWARRLLASILHYHRTRGEQQCRSKQEELSPCAIVWAPGFSYTWSQPLDSQSHFLLCLLAWSRFSDPCNWRLT